MEFKIGDKVRFNKDLEINDGSLSRLYTDTYLINGSVYIIKNIHLGGFIKLQDTQDYWYNPRQFERVYTVKECFEQKIAITCTTVEEANKINYEAGATKEWGVVGYKNGFEVFVNNWGLNSWNCLWACNNFYVGKVSLIINFNQLIFEPMKEEKQIQYYKLKPSCNKYKDAIISLTADDVKEQYLPNSTSVKRLNVAGVLDMWFDVFYEDEFKVGDWITTHLIGVSPEGQNRSTKGGFGFTPSITLQISRIEDHSNFKVYFFKNHVAGIYNGNFRKATIQEIEKARKTILTLGTSAIKVIISKNGIHADNKFWDVKKIENIHKTMKSKKRYFDEYEVEYSTVKIGCSTFTYEELGRIIDEYYKALNK